MEQNSQRVVEEGQQVTQSTCPLCPPAQLTLLLGPGCPRSLSQPPSLSLGKALSDSCPEQPRKLQLIPEAPLL